MWLRAAAVAAGASLLWTAPGLGVYELLAAEIVGVQAGAGPVTGPVPVLQLPGGPLNSPLGGLNTNISPSLQGSLPSLSQPKVAVSRPSGLVSSQPSAPVQVLESWKAGPSRVQTPRAALGGPIGPSDVAPRTAGKGIVPAAQKAVQIAPNGPIGKLGQAMVERAEKSAAQPKGLYNVLIQQVKGQGAPAGSEAAARPQAQAAPEAQYLKPETGVLASPAMSKEWGEKSFDALRGDSSASRAAAVTAELRPGVSRPGLRPALAVSRQEAAAEAPAQSAPVSAAPAAPASKPKTTLADIVLTAVPIIIGAMPLLDKIGLGALNLFAGMSWPAMIAIQVVVGLVAQLIKKQLKAGAEKKERAEAAKRPIPIHKTTTMDQEGAVQLVQQLIDSGRALEAHVFDFTLGEFRTVPIDARLLAYVQGGAFHATTDDTGAVYLVPKLDVEPAAENPAAAAPAEDPPAQAAPAIPAETGTPASAQPPAAK